MAFTVFKGAGRRSKIYISITKNKAFGLPRTFLDKYNITKNHKAVILYDKQERKIALTFSSNKPKYGLAVRIPNPKHGATIFAQSFFDDEGIEAKKYANHYDDFQVTTLKSLGVNSEGTAFVFALKEASVHTIPPAVEVDGQQINLDEFDL